MKFPNAFAALPALPNAICDAREQTVAAEIMQTCNQQWQQLVVLLLLLEIVAYRLLPTAATWRKIMLNFTQLSHENKPRRRSTAHLPHLPLQHQLQMRGETEMQLMILTTFFLALLPLLLHCSVCLRSSKRFANCENPRAVFPRSLVVVAVVVVGGKRLAVDVRLCAAAAVAFCCCVI